MKYAWEAAYLTFDAHVAQDGAGGIRARRLVAVDHVQSVLRDRRHRSAKPVAHASDADCGRRLRVLEAAVVELRRRLEQVTGEDDGRRLRCIAQAVKGAVFSAAELHEHAHLDLELRAALRELSAPVTIGRWLRGVMDREIGGLVVKRVGRDKSGVLWLVQSADDLHPGAGVGRLEGA